MSELLKHWAEDLEIGDRCIATLRHKTDGGLNKHNVPVIIISVNLRGKCIIGHTDYGSMKIEFNDLTKS